MQNDLKWKDLKQNVLDNFDFKKAFTAMKSVAWVYADEGVTDYSVTLISDIEQIKTAAKRCMDTAVREIKEMADYSDRCPCEYIVASGGFYVRAFCERWREADGLEYWTKNLEIHCVIAEWEASSFTY